MTPDELVFTFGGLHLCFKFGENRQRNATVRVMTHGQTDTQTDRQTDRHTQADFIICPIAICYSYGADNNSSWRTAAILEIENLQYLRNRSTVCNEILQKHAYCHCKPCSKNCIFQKFQMAYVPHIGNQKIVISATHSTDCDEILYKWADFGYKPCKMLKFAYFYI